MGSYTPAPEYGRRLMPPLIDEIARETPDRPAFSLPLSDSDLSQGYVDVNFATFANAVNQLAWFIEKELGRSDKFDAIAYLGTPDIRYQFLQMAVAKTGYQVLFSSHSQSLAGHLNLMEKCNCQVLLSASGVTVNDILASRPMKHVIVPELDDLLAAATVKHYPYNKTFEEGARDPYLILHTSGSTGFPKPVRYSVGDICPADAHRALPEIDANSGMRRNFSMCHPGEVRLLCPFLHFHGVASLAMMCAVLFGRGVYVNGFRHRVLERNELTDVLEHSNSDMAFFSPAMMDDLANHPEAPKYLTRMSRIIYAGGGSRFQASICRFIDTDLASLNHTAASFIAKHTYLSDQWGITESAKLVTLETDPEDFEYCAFDIEENGLEFRQVDGDVHEMIIHRTPQSYPNVVIFHREPEMTVFKPGDLWTPHPDPKKAKNVWKFHGRADDLICFQDGNNFHPAAYELKHSEHDLIHSAVIAGTGHRQPVLILELNDPSLADTPEKKSQLLDKIWAESVVPINEVAPKNGQVDKTHIVIASADKPFDRNVKGTVATKATIRKYEPESESVYKQHGDRTMDVRARFERKENQHEL